MYTLISFSVPGTVGIDVTKDRKGDKAGGEGEEEEGGRVIRHCSF